MNNFLDQQLKDLPSDTCSHCHRVMSTDEVMKYGFADIVVCKICRIDVVDLRELVIK